MTASQMALTSNNPIGLNSAPVDRGRSCSLCRASLGRIINRGAVCVSCRFRVCKNCLHQSSVEHSANVCVVCRKHIEIQLQNGRRSDEVDYRRLTGVNYHLTGVNTVTTHSGDKIDRNENRFGSHHAGRAEKGAQIQRSWTIANPEDTKKGCLQRVSVVQLGGDSPRQTAYAAKNRPRLRPTATTPRDQSRDRVPSWHERQPQRCASMSLADFSRRVKRPVFNQHHDELTSSSSSAASSPNVVRVAKSSMPNRLSHRTSHSVNERTLTSSKRVVRRGSSNPAAENCDSRRYYTLPIRASGTKDSRNQEQNEEPLYANLLPRNRLPPPVKPPRKLISQFGPGVSRSNTVNYEDRGQHHHSSDDQSTREENYRWQHDRTNFDKPDQGNRYREKHSVDDTEIGRRSRRYRLVQSEDQNFDRVNDRSSSSKSRTSVESMSRVQENNHGRKSSGSEGDKEHIRRELLLASQIFGLDADSGISRDVSTTSRLAPPAQPDTRTRLSLSPVQQRRILPSKRSLSDLKRFSLQRSGSLGEFDVKPERTRGAGDGGRERTAQGAAIRFDLRHYSPGELWEYIEIPNRFNERGVDVDVEPKNWKNSKLNSKTSRIKINAKNKNSPHKDSKLDVELNKNYRTNVKSVSKRTTQLFSDFLSLPRARASRISGEDQFMISSECDGNPDERQSKNRDDKQFRLLPSELYSCDDSPNNHRERSIVELSDSDHQHRDVPFINEGSNSKEKDARLLTGQSNPKHVMTEGKTEPALEYSKIKKDYYRDNATIGKHPTHSRDNSIGRYQVTKLNRSVDDCSKEEIRSNEGESTNHEDGVDELEQRLNHTKLTASINHHTKFLPNSSENTSDYFKSSKYPIGFTSKRNQRNLSDEQGHVINPSINNIHRSLNQNDNGKERILYNENCVRVIINGDMNSKQVANECSPALSHTTSTLPRLVHRSITRISTGPALPRSKSLHTLRGDSRPPPVRRHHLHRTSTMTTRAHSTLNPEHPPCPVTSLTSSSLVSACQHGVGDRELRTDPSGASNSDSETEVTTCQSREQRWNGKEGRCCVTASSDKRTAAKLGDVVSSVLVDEQRSVMKDVAENSDKCSIGDSGISGGGSADSVRGSVGVRTSDVVDYFERLNRCSNSAKPAYIPSNRLAHKQLCLSENKSVIDHTSASAATDSVACESSDVCGDLKLPKTVQSIDNDLLLDTVNDSFSDAEYGEYNLIDATMRYEENVSNQRSSMTSLNCQNSDLLYASEDAVESDHEALAAIEYKTPVFPAIVNNNACTHERINIENNAVLMEPLDRDTTNKTCSVPNADHLPDTLERERCMRHIVELQPSSESEAEVAVVCARSGVCADQVTNSGYVSQQPLSGFNIDQEVSTMNAVASSVHCVSSRAMRARKNSDTDTDGALSGLVTDSGVEIDSLSIDSGSAKSVVPSAPGEESPSIDSNGKRCRSTLKSCCETEEKRFCIDNVTESQSSTIETLTNTQDTIHHDHVSNGPSDDSDSILYENNITTLNHGDSYDNTEILSDSNVQLESDESFQADNFQGEKPGSHVGNFVRVISVGNEQTLTDRCSEDCGDNSSDKAETANESAEVEVVMGDKTQSFMMETSISDAAKTAEIPSNHLRSLVARSREAQEQLHDRAEFGRKTGLAGYYAGLDAPVLSSSSRAQPRTPEIRRHQRNSSPEVCSSPTGYDLRPNSSSDVRSEYSDEPPDDFHDGFDFGSEDSYRNERYDSDEYNSTEDRESNNDPFNDEFYTDDEPRFARPIDFTLTTIVEESCEDSDCDARSHSEVDRSNPSQLEKYFFFDLGNGPHDTRKYVNGESECSDAYSETSESVYSEFVDADRSIEGPFSQSSLQYFRKGFLGLNRQSSIRSVGDDSENQTDGSGSVGSDSESQNSPEQRRKKVSRFRFRTQSEVGSNCIDQPSRDLADSCSYVSSEDETKICIADDTLTCDKNKDSNENIKYRKKKKSNLSDDASDKEHVSENTHVEKVTEQCTPSKDQVDIELNKSMRLNQLSDLVEVSTSRDSGFLGSSDDLLKETQPKLFDANKSAIEVPGSNLEIGANVMINDCADAKPIHDQNIVSPCEMALNQPKIQNKGITRTDSFNNWSSDEETNILMGRLRQVFRSTIMSNSHKSDPSDCAAKPSFLINFENALRRMMRSVPGINEEQVREIVEHLSSEENWSDSYDSSDHTNSDIEGAGAVVKRDLTNLHEKSRFDIMNQSQGHINVLNNESDVLCQKLVARLKDLRNSPKYSSPPLLSKVFDHIGDRLTTLMREVTSSDSTSNSDYSPNFSDGRLQKHGSSSDFMSASPNSHSSSQPSAERLPECSIRLRKPAASDDNILATCEQVKSDDDLAKSPEDKDSIDFNKILRDSKRKKKKEFESCHNLLEKDRKTDKECKMSFTKEKWARLNGRVKSEGDVSERSLGSNNTLIMGRPLSSEFSSSDQMDSDSTLKAADSYDKHIDQSVISRRLVSGSGTACTNNSPRVSLSNETVVDKPGNSDTESEYDKRLWRVPNYHTRSSITSAPDIEVVSSAHRSGTVDVTSGSVPDVRSTLPRSAVSSVVGASGRPLVANLHPAGSRSLPRSRMTTSHKGAVLMGVSSLATDTSRSARYRPPGFRPSQTVNELRTACSGSRPLSTSDGKISAAAIRSSDSSLIADRVPSTSRPLSTDLETEHSESDRDASLRHGFSQSSNLGSRSSSLASVCSSSGGEGVRFGSVVVRGDVQLAISYCTRTSTLEVHVKQCRELAAVDNKRARSDPYVKLYLLPDCTKGGKRKTKTRKHTLSPVFDEILKFGVAFGELSSRTLWLSVWHCDMFGRNEFLGEVRLPVSAQLLDNTGFHWYQLQERSVVVEESSSSHGTIVVALKFAPPEDEMTHKRAKKTRGSLFVMVKEARNLAAVKSSGHVDSFCKSFLLPDRKTTKQKTGVVRRSINPHWGCTLMYPQLSLDELKQRGVELSVWDHGLTTSEFLGGVRLNMGTGESGGLPALWMDAVGDEISLWQEMLQRPGFWVEQALPLRAAMERYSISAREN